MPELMQDPCPARIANMVPSGFPQGDALRGDAGRIDSLNAYLAALAARTCAGSAACVSFARYLPAHVREGWEKLPIWRGPDRTVQRPVGRSKSPGYGHLKLPHSIIAVSAAEQR